LAVALQTALETNADLARVVTAWQMLSDHIRQTILTLIETVAPMQEFTVHSPNQFC
jgi:hypothetical protein